MVLWSFVNLHLFQTGDLNNALMQLFFQIGFSSVATVSEINFTIFNKQHQLHERNRVSYMSAHVLLNLLNKLKKRNKMRGLTTMCVSSNTTKESLS